jgi:hypothetical protein
MPPVHIAADGVERPARRRLRHIYCDFRDRLGTPTTNAESGTAEEIAQVGKSGRYVGMLRCRRPVDPAEIEIDEVKPPTHRPKATPVAVSPYVGRVRGP